MQRRTQPLPEVVVPDTFVRPDQNLCSARVQRQSRVLSTV